MRFLTLIILIALTNYAQASTDLVLKARVATTLLGASIYPDSSYEQQSMRSFKPGQLLEVLEETVLEYEDASQNQKYKWYKVKSSDGKMGWVYGDAIAVVLNENKVNPVFKDLHKKKHTFHQGFEKAICWIAGVEGRDNYHKKDLLNPLYKEYYLVVSNESGHCAFINISNENTSGEMKPRHFLIHDTTGDGQPELLLQTSSFNAGSDFENRVFEIYSFQANGLNRIFEERMSLSLGNGKQAPSLYKYVEVDQQIVRVAYVDYLNCDHYDLGYDYGKFDSDKDRCLAYVTYTYSWNERTKQYRMMYKESRTAPAVGSRRSTLSILDEPSQSGKSIATANRSDRIELIKVHQKELIEKIGYEEKTTYIPYFKVKLRNGTTGYVRATEVGFIDIEHAPMLNDFYKTENPDQSVWKTEKHFLKITGDDRSSYTGK